MFCNCRIINYGIPQLFDWPAAHNFYHSRHDMTDINTLASVKTRVVNGIKMFECCDSRHLFHNLVGCLIFDHVWVFFHDVLYFGINAICHFAQLWLVTNVSGPAIVRWQHLRFCHEVPARGHDLLIDWFLNAIKRFLFLWPWLSLIIDVFISQVCQISSIQLTFWCCFNSMLVNKFCYVFD